MIEVSYFADQAVRGITLRVAGHAGFAPEGEDVVCAAASVLAVTLARFVTAEFRAGRAPVPPAVRLCSGDALISARALSSSAYVRLLAAFSALLGGFSFLASSFPECVSIRECVNIRECVSIGEDDGLTAEG